MYNDENALIRSRKIVNQIKGVEHILEVLKSRRGFSAGESQLNPQVWSRNADRVVVGGAVLDADSVASFPEEWAGPDILSLSQWSEAFPFQTQ